MRYVITDIETSAHPDAERMLPEFKHNAGTNDADKRAAQIAEKRAKALADAALDPDLCRIVAIGSWWNEEQEPRLHLCNDESVEAAVLSAYWQTYAQHRWEHPHTVIVGSNCLGFDLPVMVRRSLYLNVEVPMLERGKYRHRDVIDLKSLLCDDDRLAWRSLDYYVRRFQLDVPHDAIDGAQIPALVAAGEWPKVESHLHCDLLKTRALALRVVPSLREMAVTA
jgi:predicted 3'-5' exonuclease similar to PolB exonuclease domain